MVWPRFAAWMLVDPDDGVIRFAGDDDAVTDANNGVATLYREWIDTEIKPDEERWGSASSAAWERMADKLIELLEGEK